MLLDLLLAMTAVGVALALRPWRMLGAGGPPWPWLACAALMPLLWGADRWADSPLALPQSGACLLLMLAGWPLAVLAFVPVALVTALGGDLGWDQALHRMAWLGVVPATLALALGAAVRRWLPRFLFVYILGRGFFATALALTATALLSALLHNAPAPLQPGDWLLARVLAAWGDAFITGMVVAIFVALRPHWLATYSDRLYLPLRPPD